MGYQESLIRVGSLAEVSGICRAIEESEELKTLEYLVCCCAGRAKRNLYYDGVFGPSGISDISGRELSPIRKGDLFAIVAGARLYQPFLWIDCIAGIDETGRNEPIEVIPLEQAHIEGRLHPDDARKGEVFMRRSLNRSYNLAIRGRRPIDLPKEFLESTDQILGSKRMGTL